jgi:signal transduction histidine kinase
MTNIFKHAQAFRADILFEDMGDGKLRLVIRDDGIGLTKEKVREARQQNRLGIYGMQERIRILGGHMAIRSERPEWSTVYEITLRSTDKGGETFDESNDRR